MENWIQRLAGARDWVVVVLTVECVLLFGILRAQGAFQHAGMDFLTSYTAAELLVHGDGQHLYETRIQWQYQRPIVDRYDVHWNDRVMHPYIAPPLLGALTVPLLSVAPVPAAIIWSVLNLLAVASALWLLARRLPLDGRTAAAVVFGSFPLFYVAFLGQVEGLLVLAFAVFMTELRSGREGRAGLALAVFGLKPQLLVAPLVFLAITGRRRTLSTTVGSLIAQGFVSLAIVGSGGVRDFVALSRRLSGPGGTTVTNVQGMVNLRGVVVRALPVESGPLMNATIAALIAATLIGAAWSWRRAGDFALTPPGLALLAVTLLLTSYHALYHTAIFAVIAVVLLLAPLGNPSTDARAARLVVFSIAFFSAGPLLLFLVWRSSTMPAALSIIGVLLLWGIAAYALASMVQPAPAPEDEPVPRLVGVRPRQRSAVE